MDALTRERYPDVDLDHEREPWLFPLWRRYDADTPQRVAQRRRQLWQAMHEQEEAA